MVRKNHSCLFLIISSLSELNMVFSTCWLFTDTLIRLWKFISIPCLMGTCIVKECWILPSLFYMAWDNLRFFSCFTLVIWFITLDDFWMPNDPCISGGKFQLVMIYYIFIDHWIHCANNLVRIFSSFVII